MEVDSEEVPRLWAAGDYSRLARYAGPAYRGKLTDLSPAILTFIGLGAALDKKLGHAVVPLSIAYEKAPDDVSCALNLGNCLKDLGKFDEALRIYYKNPLSENDPLVLLGRGICQNQLRDYEGALLNLRKAQEISPKNKNIIFNIGLNQFCLERLEAAEESFENSLRLDSGYPAAAINLSMVRIRLHKYSLGLSLADQVLKSGYRNESYMRTLITASMQAGQAGIAKLFYEKYCSNASPQLDFTAAEIYRYLKDFAVAIKICEKVIKKDRGFYAAYIILYHSLAEQGLVLRAARFRDLALKKCNLYSIRVDQIPNPWTEFAVYDDPARQLSLAKRYAESVLDVAPRAKFSNRSGKKKRPVVAYLSPDFKTHPVAECLIRVLERHNKDKYKVIGLSLASNLDHYSKLVAGAMDEFHRCEEMTYEQLRALCEEKSVDILIDLAVYTSHGRPGYTALGLAPTQVNFLGYSGTSGSAGYDLIVADEFIIPGEAERHYSERVIRLDVPLISGGITCTDHLASPDKSDHGVGRFSVVFGCLANPYKMTAEMISAWAEILLQVDDSCLLLGNMKPEALDNIRKVLRANGVREERVVQSPFQETRDQHLARLKVVDLFLDTFPYNAHSLAADAVSAGVPVVTLVGNTFASRVAGSLNSFLNLHKLNAGSLADYVRIAVSYGNDMAALAEIKDEISLKVAATDWAGSYAAELEERLFLSDVFRSKG